jgi:hypothetical protein
LEDGRTEGEEEGDEEEGWRKQKDGGSEEVGAGWMKRGG